MTWAITASMAGVLMAVLLALRSERRENRARILLAMTIGSATAVAAVFLAFLTAFISIVGSHGSEATGPGQISAIFAAVIVVGCCLSGMLTGWLVRVRGGLHGGVVGVVAALAAVSLSGPDSHWRAMAASPDLKALAGYLLLPVAAIALCALGGKLGERFRLRYR